MLGYPLGRRAPDGFEALYNNIHSIMAESSESKRKAPPVPKFDHSEQHQAQMQLKMEQFVKEIGKEAVGEELSAVPQEKKKQSISSINEKLASLMKSKKGLIEKSKVEVARPAVEIVQAPLVNEEYDPGFLNHYEECCHLFEFQDEIPVPKGPPTSSTSIQDTSAQEEPQLSEAEQKALKMMQKYGFKVGEGLGKHSQGMTTPLIVKKTTDISCTVIQSSITLQNLIKPQTAAKLSLQRLNILPSNVIVLHDILNLEQLDEEAEVQIKAECERFGNVVGWLVFLLNTKLRIFVHYQKQEEAFAAFVYLNHKYYAGKKVSVRFYSLEYFERGDLSQPLHDHISF